MPGQSSSCLHVSAVHFETRFALRRLVGIDQPILINLQVVLVVVLGAIQMREAAVAHVCRLADTSAQRAIPAQLGLCALLESTPVRVHLAAVVVRLVVGEMLGRPLRPALRLVLRATTAWLVQV